MIQVVFTARDTFVSRAIRYLTGEEVSHVAIRCGDIVVHSTGKGGVEQTTWSEFSSNYEVKLQALTPGNKRQILNVAKRLKDAPYDYTGLTWLAIRYVIKKYFRINIPKVNLWQLSGMFTCTEFVTEVIDGDEDSLITPYQLYERLTNG